MINKMAAFFRASLCADVDDLIPLSEELALQRVYLGIERVRFPHLEVVEEIEPPCLKQFVPALILQPLIENAVKYGVARGAGSSWIGVFAACVDDMITISVRDRGGGVTKAQGTGTGLRNVEERLRALYGSRASLTSHSPAEGGFEVRLSIPTALS